MFRILKFFPIRLTKIPQYNILQNSNRLRTKPKFKEIEIPFIERTIFIDKSFDVLLKLQDAFTQLKEHENRIEGINLQTKSEDDSIELTVNVKDHGVYIMTANPKERILYIQSPVAGIQKYFFDEVTQQWCSSRDRHFMLESLSREASKHLKAFLYL